jgi:hypothetical protein
MNAKELSRILTIQYRYTSWVFGKAVGGIDDATAIVPPRPAGNCLNWVAGHIINARTASLQVLGRDLPFPEDKYERYCRGSAPVVAGENVPPLSEMVADFEATDGPLLAGLVDLTDRRVGEKAPFSPGDDPKETVGSLLAGLFFHEAYHTGQLGILRRLDGAEAVSK